jgi:hypothetical protein
MERQKVAAEDRLIKKAGCLLTTTPEDFSPLSFLHALFSSCGLFHQGG